MSSRKTFSIGERHVLPTGASVAVSTARGGTATKVGSTVILGTPLQIADSLEKAETIPAEYARQRRQDTSSQRRDKEQWFGPHSKTYAEFRETMRTNPLSLMSWDAADLGAQVTTGDNRAAFDVTGDWLDVGRFMEGCPEVFGSYSDGDNRLNGAIQFVIEVSACAGVKAEALSRMGQAVLAQVDACEAIGVRCSVIGVMPQESATMVTYVKDFADPFDGGALAIALHPSFFRRVGFEVIERSLTNLPYGYGGRTKPEQAVEVARAVGALNEHDESVRSIAVGSYMGWDADDERKLDRAVRDAITAFGGHYE